MRCTRRVQPCAYAKQEDAAFGTHPPVLRMSVVGCERECECECMDGKRAAETRPCKLLKKRRAVTLLRCCAPAASVGQERAQASRAASNAWIPPLSIVGIWWTWWQWWRAGACAQTGQQQQAAMATGARGFAIDAGGVACRGHIGSTRSSERQSRAARVRGCGI